ncbi:GSCOCG00002700001-RA-CDS, partial [Cotesia congregata]
IYTDASLTDWGAFCNDERVHGWWTQDDQKCQINQLELKAALLGLKCFAKNCFEVDILLHIDNTTAIACINKMGSVQ